MVPLAAHLFIFYFGMMSMVTPPVALAAYAASSIAGSKLLETGVSAFKFALVGFALPYVFVFRPQLLMLAPGGGAAPVLDVLLATVVVVAGVLAFAIAIAGHGRGPVGAVERAFFLIVAGLLFFPTGAALLGTLTYVQAAGGLLLLGAVVRHWRSAARPTAA